MNGPSASVLNEALCAYVRTFPSRNRLAEHISQCGLEEQADEIAGRLKALLLTADDYLFSQTEGVTWTRAFEDGFRAHLCEAHPWLDDQGIETIFSYSGWLCWHEGLETPNPARLARKPAD